MESSPGWWFIAIRSGLRSDSTACFWLGLCLLGKPPSDDCLMLAVSLCPFISRIQYASTVFQPDPKPAQTTRWPLADSCGMYMGLSKDWDPPKIPIVYHHPVVSRNFEDMPKYATFWDKKTHQSHVWFAMSLALHVRIAGLGRSCLERYTEVVECDPEELGKWWICRDNDPRNDLFWWWF